MAKQKLDGISDGAVQKATGRGWNEWLAMLDEAGAAKWDHKQIVAHLRDNYELSGWWQQTVTVAYEKARGRRVVGQTAEAGFQVGVQQTLPLSRDDAWKLIASRQGIATWLGKVGRFSLAEGRRYTTSEGIEGEIRIVKPGDRVRLTWQRPGMKRPATLQIALISSSPEKTSLRFHLEHLPSARAREQMKGQWRGVLARLAALAAGNSAAHRD